MASRDFLRVFGAAPLPLLRTTSLPTETEEERWRRREMQSRRRLEARRKRVERRNSMGSVSVAPADAVSGRRSNASQGSNSASTTEQGIHEWIVVSCPQLLPFNCLCLLNMLLMFSYSYHGFLVAAAAAASWLQCLFSKHHGLLCFSQQLSVLHHISAGERLKNPTQANCMLGCSVVDILDLIL
ncbi:Ninja-family protein 6 [Zea mays]|uniref:Ninja-family protein n=1 Tax=Zea mays TaxID=4577 RepID=A0A1D6P8E7_MAIZE|nr:Ninja-family protein 6 [Zea mays]